MADFDWSGFGDNFSRLGDLWGQYNSFNTARNTNNQVQGITGLQQGLANNQAQDLQRQIQESNQIARTNYDRSLADVTAQNQGLEGTIGTMSQNLQALSDPNSPYMQMARQAIERKDAAAGRRSQWGDREVQLAATLADQVGKYAPGLNNSITSARNQINQNNQGLANLWNQMTMSSDRNNISLTQLINGLNNVANTANTTGRQASQAQNNGMTSLFNTAGSAIGGLGRLFGSLGSERGGIMEQLGSNGGVLGYTPQWGGDTGGGGYTLNNDFSGQDAWTPDYFRGASAFGGGGWESGLPGGSPYTGDFSIGGLSDNSLWDQAEE